MTVDFEDPKPTRWYDKRRISDRLEIFSFLLFLATNVFAISFLGSVYWVFLILILLDGFATLFHIDSIISLDRLLFVFILIILSDTILSFNIIFLILETLLLLVLIEFSFLLRRLSDTRFEFSVLKKWWGSYAKVLVPTFFLSFALIYIYSLLPTSQNLAAPIFAISSVGVIFVVLLLARSLSTSIFSR